MEDGAPSAPRPQRQQRRPGEDVGGVRQEVHQLRQALEVQQLDEAAAHGIPRLYAVVTPSTPSPARGARPSRGTAPARPHGVPGRAGWGKVARVGMAHVIVIRGDDEQRVEEALAADERPRAARPCSSHQSA